MSLSVTPVSPGVDSDLPYGGIVISDENGNIGKLSNGTPGERGPMGPQAVCNCNKDGGEIEKALSEYRRRHGNG